MGIRLKDGVHRNGPSSGSAIGGRGNPTGTNGPWSGIPSSGGSSPPSLPPNSGAILEWLKADAITGHSSGDTITTWPKSIGFDAVGAGGATYITNGQNSLPIVRFNGTTNGLSTGSQWTQSLPVTIALAAKYTSGFYFFNDPFVSNSFLTFLVNGGKWEPLGTASIVSANTSFHIFFIVAYNSSSSLFGIDGAALSNITPGSSITNSTGINLATNQSGDAFGAVDIGEVIYYQGDQSGIYSQIYSWLNGRWA